MTVNDALAAFTRHLHRRVLRHYLRFTVINAANDNGRT